MIPNANTKYIGRIHTKPSARGLNIYNPYFEEMGINALYILFYQNTPEKLLNACRDLFFVALNTAGFEEDHEFAKLVDDFDESSKLVGHVGYLKNIDGKMRAYYQGGEALLQTLLTKFPLTGQEVVIVGAGNVATSLISSMNKNGIKPKKLTVVNRTLAKADALKQRLSNIDEVRPLTDLADLSGDVLVNCTHLGGRDTDNFFTVDVLKNFGGIGDVTFEIAEPNIIKVAQSLQKPFTSGHDFFTFQGKVFLENILDIKVDVDVLRKHVIKGLEAVV